jgi:hypothetical protein
MGRNIREIGKHRLHGEAVHQSALDRFNDARCAYRPPNLKQYIDSGEVRVVDTTRIERGHKP